jgi:signal transduction histidine kinase
MSRRPAADPELQVMREIVARVDALNELIGDLLVFARPRAPRLVRVEVRRLLEEAVSMLRRDPLGARITVEIDGPDVTIDADAELVRATVLNLLINAAQAMAGNGTIAISVSHGPASAVIDIRDSGPGIPAGMSEQVFEPFVTTKARGGGLGLPIARRTAELHGGSLALVSAAGGGMLLRLTLPVRPGAVGPSGVAHTAPGADVERAGVAQE